MQTLLYCICHSTWLSNPHLNYWYHSSVVCLLCPKLIDCLRGLVFAIAGEDPGLAGRVFYNYQPGN